MSHDDKDIHPSINKLVQLCTVELVFLMQEVDELHPMDLEDKVDEIDYAMDPIRDINYIEPLYGNQSRLSYQEFVAQSESKKNINQVWYQPNVLRNLVFTKVELPIEEAEKKSFEALAKEINIVLTEEDY